MRQKLTVTIGIPAYNEEANIVNLLDALCRQHVASGSLQNIILVSDGSTDHTVERARSVKDPRIKVIQQTRREGKNAALQRIAAITDSDVLVLMDADVLPAGSTTIESVVRRFRVHPSPDLVGLHTESLPPRYFLERVFSVSHALKNDLYRRIRGGNNVYLCYGRACALSRQLYTTIQWPTDCPEDAYTYLSCVSRGRRFQYAPDATVVFRSPGTVRDYLLQSRRFRNGLDALSRFFDRSLIEREYHVPFGLILATLASFFIRHPITTVAYVVVNLIGRLARRSTGHHPLWEIATTSKQVHHSTTIAS